MERIAVASDHHFFHRNIIKYCNRPFPSLEAMHERMIKDWNKSVTKDTIVVHLGDFICGGSFDQVKEVLDQLNGFKILVTGNHDRKGKAWLKRAGFNRVFTNRWTLGMYTFSHRVQSADYLLEMNTRYNFHGHSHKYHYGDPFYNFGVDVVGYVPKLVKTNLTREELMYGEGRCERDPLVDIKHRELPICKTYGEFDRQRSGRR